MASAFKKEATASFLIAKGKTLPKVTFIEPCTITYVRAEDAPRQRTFPYGY
jgi:hypothetical protein